MSLSALLPGENQRQPKPGQIPTPGQGGFDPMKSPTGGVDPMASQTGGVDPSPFNQLGTPPSTGGVQTMTQAGGTAPPSQGGGLPTHAPQAPKIDPQQTWATLTSQFQQKFNRAMTPQEAQALQQYAGYSGGEINQQMIDKATQGIQAYSGNLSNPWGPTPTTPTPQTQGNPEPGLATNQQMHQQLQQLLTSGTTPAMSNVDMNNPAIRAQQNNFARVNDQARGRERLAAAERAAASNTLGAGGYNADLMAVEQGASQRSADFESQLMTRELEGQRSRVMQAMDLAGRLGDSAQSRALQERLAAIDAQLRGRGLDLQGQLGRGQLSLGLLQALMGDRQMSNRLGVDLAGLQLNANNQALMNILNGL